MLRDLLSSERAKGHRRPARAWAALAKDRAAVTALEYGIVASILGLVLVEIFSGFGRTLSTLFSSAATSI